MKNLSDVFKRICRSRIVKKAVAYKPLRDAIRLVAFLSLLLFLLSIITPQLNLYVSIRDSIVEMSKLAHIVIKKKNNLFLIMGHSDSRQGLVDDGYKVTPDKDGIATIYFAIINSDGEERYRSVRLFIQFTDENRKVDGRDGGGEGWVMFKSNHFNYGPISEILEKTKVQMNRLHLISLEKGVYEFKYSLYADGYKPKVGLKKITIE